MSTKQITKIIFINIFYITLCLILTSCSLNDKNTNQTSVSDMESTTESPYASVQPSNQTDSTNEKKVIKSWEEYEASELPLISALKEKSIFLYGKKSGGVLLQTGDGNHEFKWEYLTPRFVLPEMYVSDFDSDGKDELAVILYIGSGTGVSIEDLHIVEISEAKTLSGLEPGKPNPEYFKDYLYDYYTSQLNKEIGFKTFYNASELMGKITFDTRTYTVSLRDYQTKEFGKINNDLTWGSIVRFNVEKNRLVAEFGVGITSQSIASPSFIGTLYAEVDYSAGRFKLKNFKFQEIQDY